MQVAFRGLGGLLRGAGAAIDAAGASLQGKLAPAEKLLPCVSRLTIGGATPVVPEGVFVAPNAAVMGHVELGAHSSVWYGATLRGDVQKIKIGHTTNIQDRAIIHVAKHNPQDKELPTTIGNNVTVGHGAIVHACTIEDDVLIGMGAKVLDGAVVKRSSIVAAGSMVAPGTTIPSGEVWSGVPARKLRDLTPEEAAFITRSAESYAALGAKHLAENQKVWLTVLHDDQLREDIMTRNPNSDSQLGLVRDPVTREITADPYDAGKMPV